MFACQPTGLVKRKDLLYFEKKKKKKRKAKNSGCVM